MIDSKTILYKLRENNPFASDSSPLPWDNKNPDLAQLSRKISEEIEHLILQKRREPSTPLSGLILGEAGSGKTHMLMRILKKLRENENTAIFVMAEMFREPERITQDMLSYIFQSLRHIHRNGLTQFDIIVREVMNVYEEKRRNDGYDDINKIDKHVYLLRDMPRLDRNFLKCILIYAETQDETVKHSILEWLEYGLDEEDSQKLGLPAKNMDAMSDSKRESLAEKMLVSLGLILGYVKIPMIVCFDQLEIMKERSLINAWENLISIMMNYMQAALPLCFIKPDTWQNHFVPVLDTSIIERIRSNTMRMESCTEQYARQLIYDRIKNAFGKDSSEEIYQWLIHQMNSTIKPDMSPRRIIAVANKIIMSDDSADQVNAINQTISVAYNEEYKRIQAEVHTWPPKAENLTLSLSAWLESYEGFEVSKTTDKYIKLIGKYKGNRYAFVILTSKAHATVTAGLRHGMSFMQEYPDGKCWYITEERTHKRTWKQANENLARFQEAGGHVIMLNKDTRVNWYALTALINRTDNGDVDLYFPTESRTASRNDIKTFIRSIKLIPEIFGEENGENKPPRENDALMVNLKNILNSSPMHIISVEKAIEMLSRRKIIIARSELISFLRNNSKAFRTFNSSNDMLISLLKD